MKIELPAQVLKDAINISAKSAGFNPMIPRTNLVDIHSKDNFIYFITTDGNNTLHHKVEIHGIMEFRVVTDLDPLRKLVRKFKSGSITLEVEGKNLIVRHGKSQYKFGLPVDGAGELLHVDWDQVGHMVESQTVPYSELDTIVRFGKPVIDKSFLDYLNGYYFGTNAYVYMTDSVIMSTLMLENPWAEGAFMLHSSTMEIMADIFSGEESLEVSVDDDGYFCVTTDSKGMVASTLDTGDYPQAALDSMLEMDAYTSFHVDANKFKDTVSRQEVVATINSQYYGQLTVEDAHPEDEDLPFDLETRSIALSLDKSNADSLEVEHLNQTEDYKPFEYDTSLMDKVVSPFGAGNLYIEITDNFMVFRQKGDGSNNITVISRRSST